MSTNDSNGTTPESTTSLQSNNDCITCRIIGSGAFAATGVYALRMSRASAPGSLMGKRIMGGLGIGKRHITYISWYTPVLRLC
ncbi:hypothetical protein BJ138DRAFT_1094328 [Hygrophoropsis aurantiaca]|uniref:Uncharacterized protein n=1 Tax=Hygrophoropsis aurantiaca TaxID=72124 RepID=A0ACB7ZZH8_9AGAM|nr:hypothetical protein BJ138DRAFT_1094328 [Hygrophoropsis aurantiaca]